MPAYPVILLTASDCSYSQPVSTLEQATVNSNPFINISELIESPEQLLTIPHMDAQDPDGDNLSFSIAMSDEGRDVKYGSAQAQRLFFLIHKALSGSPLVGPCSWSALVKGLNPATSKKNAFALINRSPWGKLHESLDPGAVNKALY